VPLLAAEGLAPALLALPPVVGALIFFAIRWGEKARSQDRHRLRAKAAAPAAQAPRGENFKALGRSALKALYAVPVLGWLLKDAVNGRASAKAFFALNCALLLAAAVAVFGYPVLIVAALALVPVVFVSLFVLTWA
jgi:hypothetical protein